MVAIKVTNLTPALIVLHGLTNVDEIAKRIAEAEEIPLTVSRIPRVEEITNRLRQIDV